MPSGAKKRKAAKKKKEKETPHNPSANNRQGNDDVKSQDGKESDSGEVNSPGSRDLDSDQNSFNEKNEDLDERDPTIIESFVAEEKSTEVVSSDVEGPQKMGSEHDVVVKIEREMKSEENSETKNGRIDHHESVKEPHSENNSSSSSSSSDDESRVTEKKPKEEAYKFVFQASSSDDLIKPVNSSEAEVTWAAENAPVGETVESVVENPPVVDSVKSEEPVSEETIPVIPTAPAENPLIADVVESVSEESEERLPPESKEAPATVPDLALQKNEDKVFPLSDEKVYAAPTTLESATSNGAANVSNGNEGKILPSSTAPVAATSNDEASVSNGYEGKILPSSTAPVTATSNGAANLKDSEIPESSENQPLVAPAPQVVRRSSVLSCCGLLELLTGSGR